MDDFLCAGREEGTAALRRRLQDKCVDKFDNSPGWDACEEKKPFLRMDHTVDRHGVTCSGDEKLL